MLSPGDPMTHKNNRMPVLFVGHGNPMNAIEDSIFSHGWKEASRRIPVPKNILCISAHWETDTPAVTSSPQPDLIYDFYGFPEELYTVQYPAPGDPVLAERVRFLAGDQIIRIDSHRGLDHGCWAVLKRMYPDADIPVVQLSLGRSGGARGVYDLAQRLMPLRDEGTLILGSGNIVHNLGLVSLRGSDFNEPFAFDWTEEARATVKRLVEGRDDERLIDYPSLGHAVHLAVPTPEHFLPLLTVLGATEKREKLEWFNDQAVAGSLTMTCLKIRG